MFTKYGVQYNTDELQVVFIMTWTIKSAMHSINILLHFLTFL